MSVFLGYDFLINFKIEGSNPEKDNNLVGVLNRVISPISDKIIEASI